MKVIQKGCRGCGIKHKGPRYSDQRHKLMAKD